MRTYLSRGVSLIGLLVFVLAVIVLYHKVRAIHLIDVAVAVGQLSRGQVAAAFLFTLLSYCINASYDLIALGALKSTLKAHALAASSFICHTVSHNVGFGALSGGSLRYRLYKRLGLRGSDVVYMVTFGMFSFWLGLLLLAGLVFVVSPPEIPPDLGLPPLPFFWIGLLCLATVGAYMAGVIGGHSVRVWKWTISFPPLRYALTQLIVGASDWVVASAVFYALLPHVPGMTFMRVVHTFFIAQICGLISQSPAGLGVFETVIFKLLPGNLPASTILSALLMYRIIYNVIPLSLAILLLGIGEVSHKRHHVRDAFRWSWKRLGGGKPDGKDGEKR
jgi:uncharacterized membrane protein YbhN (UPF0104 family)